MNPLKGHQKGTEIRETSQLQNLKDLGSIMVDPDGIVTSCSVGNDLFIGYHPYELVGKSYARFFDQDDIAKGIPEHQLKLAKKQGKYESEDFLIKKDGSGIRTHVVISAMHDANNCLIGFSLAFGSTNDQVNIAEKLLQTSAQLRENEERYRLLIEGVKDYAIVMLSPEGIINSWNYGAERIIGYKAEEIIGRSFSKFYLQEAIDGGFPKYEITSALERGRFENEGWRVRKGGSVFWANVVITALYNADNEHIGFSKITRDLTQKVKNEELTKKNRELLKINTDLDNFIYSASHDLKAPVANLEGLMNILKRRIGDGIPSSETEILEMMDTSVHKLRSTINDLAEITKAQKGLEKKMSEITIEEVLEEVISDLDKMVAEAGAKIIKQIEVKTIYQVKGNLRTILYNLLTNAIKYRSSDRKLIVGIKSYCEDNCVVLVISDNGMGLSGHQLDKLFVMFRRFHSHVEGTGIGLYIIKRIIENSGGKIKAESQLGEGTVFKIYFPLHNDKPSTCKA